MERLIPAHFAENNGSLIYKDKYLVASYDLENGWNDYSDPNLLNNIHDKSIILNASISAFQIDYLKFKHLNIVNGMGVALGDSIIGISALQILKQLNPQLNINLFRPRMAPLHVKEIYHALPTQIANIRDLPIQITELSADELNIDVGNHFFWDKFHQTAMIDFFLWALGINYSNIPAQLKTNAWLQEITLPDLPEEWQTSDYILFCPRASTPIRSIPAALHQSYVEQLWQHYKCPILGFAEVQHHHYINISQYSTTTLEFIAWIKSARLLFSVDSSAIHIAAGFNLPTCAIFNTISPQLRAGNYPNCASYHLDIAELNQVHNSACSKLQELVVNAYHQLQISRLLAEVSAI